MDRLLVSGGRDHPRGCVGFPPIQRLFQATHTHTRHSCFEQTGGSCRSCHNSSISELQGQVVPDSPGSPRKQARYWVVASRPATAVVPGTGGRGTLGTLPSVHASRTSACTNAWSCRRSVVVRGCCCAVWGPVPGTQRPSSWVCHTNSPRDSVTPLRPTCVAGVVMLLIWTSRSSPTL